jgi:hypothetical protein
MSYWHYNENFESGEKKEEKKEHKIDEKEETIEDLYMLVIGYTIIIVFGIYFHRYFYNVIPHEIFKLSIISTITFPLIIFSYYIFHQIYSVREGETYEKLLEESEQEVEQESKISTVIPVILFGIGIVYGSLEKISKKVNLLKIVAPYLIFSLLLGTIIPYIISYLIFDHHDIKRLLIASDFDFISVSISFGLMITTLLIPFVILY